MSTQIVTQSRGVLTVTTVARYKTAGDCRGCGAPLWRESDPDAALTATYELMDASVGLFRFHWEPGCVRPLREHDREDAPALAAIQAQFLCPELFDDQPTPGRPPLRAVSDDRYQGRA